jgi:hypothetical protein
MNPVYLTGYKFHAMAQKSDTTQSRQEEENKHPAFASLFSLRETFLIQGHWAVND